MSELNQRAKFQSEEQHNEPSRSPRLVATGSPKQRKHGSAVSKSHKTQVKLDGEVPLKSQEPSVRCRSLERRYKSDRPKFFEPSCSGSGTSVSFQEERPISGGTQVTQKCKDHVKRTSSSSKERKGNNGQSLSLQPVPLAVTSFSSTDEDGCMVDKSADKLSLQDDVVRSDKLAPLSVVEETWLKSEPQENCETHVSTQSSCKEVKWSTPRPDRKQVNDQNSSLPTSPQLGLRSTSCRAGKERASMTLTSASTVPALHNSKVRRALSFGGTKNSPGKGEQSPLLSGSINDQRNMYEWLDSGNNSVDSLRTLNLDLRDHLSKLRHQLEAQRGSIKHVHWQKVLDIRHVRQQEQERLTLALKEQKEKLDKERGRELENIREQLISKAESDLQRLTRHKDAEIAKLKMEVSAKDSLVQRLLGENRQTRLKLDIDVRRWKLMEEIKELRQQKKNLEESLSSASLAERSFSNHLRRNSEDFESEVARIRREAKLENKQLIEQLKNKDKLISQLEKDLGQQWVAAQLAALERDNREGAYSPSRGSPSHPLGALPEDSYDPTTSTWTPTSTSTTGGVEEAWSSSLEGNLLGKQDLSKKLKDCKDRNKELVEKCRAYLQRNKELTAQNRAYKDSSEKVLQENKKMQELLEHSKLRTLQLSRQLNEAESDKTSLERHTEKVEDLRQEMMEDKKTISALKQAVSEKDRRIELIQHRKKRRRLIGSAEKNMGVKETFFGYDEDSKSVDSENSQSSVSHSTISDEDAWDNMLSKEETEHQYQKLMMEHLLLQKANALLQSQSEHIQDPQREALTKMTLQNDLFNAQCRIEKLEKLINEIGKGEAITLLRERETIVATNKEFLDKAQFWENQSRCLQLELNKALEKCEDLEFQLVEIEQAQDEAGNSSCENSLQSSSEKHEQLERLAELDQLQQAAQKDMEQLRKDLVILLKGQGREADAVLKRLDQITEDEKKRAESWENMAHELQMKVIALQKDRDSLQERLNLSGGHKAGKVEPASKGQPTATITAAAKEKQENLELMTEIAKLSSSESKLLAEQIHLKEQLEDWKIQNEYLKQQLDILLTQKHQESQIKADTSQAASSCSSSPSSSASSSPSQLTRKPSKDRKSKPRSGDDPTETKRRRSSKDPYSSGDSHSGMKKLKSLGDIKSDLLQFSRSSQSTDDIESSISRLDEMEQLKQTLKSMQRQLLKLQEENLTLQDQLKQCALEKSSEVEADQPVPLDILEVLKLELDLLRRENVALIQKVKQREEEFHDSLYELNPRVSELEDFCEDLQERLRTSEMSERQMRDKLKMMEFSIDDAESNEMAVREKYEELMSREAEAKKQIHELQRTGRELRDIVLDKDIVEQALRDKVDFLQRAEAASVKRIEELETIEIDLREQLELQLDPKERNQRELNKIQELKHQITFLETDNKALSTRVAELEENEETLRENWRRVADEDFNRTQCLEEKVKLLEALNRDLKSKLIDAQEYFVINTVTPSGNSLADELALSQSKPIRPAASFDGDDDDSVDGQEGSTDTSLQDCDRKVLREKLRKLEKQLSDVSEQKNTTIESLQEKIVSMRENELKLSESIAEMEMTERELRAKLALYESSEVTVEKMLKYQSKIEELRTSQESLLDQIESMENQEMTLQEKLQEVERTLRGKIVTLEVEMKGYKQRELKDKGRIRELEKQEKDLSEKLAQQAEKENGLYVKISSLKDELKTVKNELASVRTRMEEKEDQVRKAKLLEVKLLEMEMEYGKKLSAVSSKLRHKEEELRQKEAAHEEALHQELAAKDVVQAQDIASLEKTFAQKEKDQQLKMDELKENIKKLMREREEIEVQMKYYIQSNNELKNKDVGYEKELEILRQEVTSIAQIEKEYKKQITLLQGEVEREKQRADEAERKASSLEQDLTKEKENVLVIESKIVSLKGDISDKMRNIESSFVEKEKEYEKMRQSLLEETTLKEERVRELEKELGDRVKHVGELELQHEQLKSKAAADETDMSSKLLDLEKLLAESQERLEELKRSLSEKDREYEEQMVSWEAEYDALKDEISDRDVEIKHLRESMDKLSSVKTDEAMLEKELKNQIVLLNAQLAQKQSTSNEQERNNEQALLSEIDRLLQEVEHHKHELIQKLSELEVKNKDNCQLSLELSNLHHSNKTLQKELDNYKSLYNENERKFQSQIQERDQSLDNFRQNLVRVQRELVQLKQELLQKDSAIQEAHSDKAVELDKVKDSLASQNELLQKQLIELNENSEIKYLHSQTEILNQKLSMATQNLDLKTKEAEQYLKDVHELQEENNIIVSNYDILAKELQENQELILQKTSQEAHSDKAVELEKVKDNLASQNELLQKQLVELNEKNGEIKDLHSQTEVLNQKLSMATQNLDLKTKEAEQYLKEVQELQEENNTIVSNYDILAKELQENQELILQKTSQHTDSQSLVSAKQQELEQARTELQKCWQEIEKYRTSVQKKKNKLQQRDQTHKETLAQFEQLNEQHQELDQICKQMESEVAAVELRLVEAENRYRELETKCASLEMQLEERFAETQEAAKIIKLKEEECQAIENKLTIVEMEYEETSAQFEKTEAILKEKEAECHHLASELENIKKAHRKFQDTLLEVEKEQQTESTALRNDLNRYQTEQHDLQVQIKFLKAQVTDLEDKCEEAQRQLETSEFRLLESTQKCRKLETELKENESHVFDSDNYLTALQADVSALEKRCGRLETQLKTSEDCVQELKKLAGDKDKAIEDLQSQLKGSDLALQETCADFKSRCAELEKSQQDLKISAQKCYQFKGQLSLAESKLLGKSRETEKLTARISNLEKALEEKESFCRDSQSVLDSLEQKKQLAQTECESLKTQLTFVQQTVSQTQVSYEECQASLREAKAALDHSHKELADCQSKLLEKEKMYSAVHSSLENCQHNFLTVQEETKIFAEKANMLEDNLQQAIAKSRDLETSCHKLSEELKKKETMCQKFQEESNAKAMEVSRSESSKSSLSSSVAILNQENEKLKKCLEETETKLHSSESDVSELIATNQALSGKLFQQQKTNEISESKVAQLEQRLSEVSEGKEEALKKLESLETGKKQLAAFLEDASKKHESMKKEFEKSQIERVHELSKLKEDSMREVHMLQQELVENSNMISLVNQDKKTLQDQLHKQNLWIENMKGQMQILVNESEVARERCEQLVNENEELAAKLSQANATINQLQSTVVSLKKEVAPSVEKMVSATLVTDAKASPAYKGDSNDTDYKAELSSMEMHHSETVSKLEKLMQEVQLYKSNDSQNEVKLHSLEQVLKEMREKEHRLSERVHELEGREKELLEQIADVETTVILPLEAENQELKDEISVVKQERDDAQAKAIKWGHDDDDDDQSDVESVHKSLEDALFQRDELEKKIDIFSTDVTKLEQEKEDLEKKLVDLEATAAEQIDKIEYLEDEVERLHGLEKSKSVVEEAETCLMDRVLDLEEREQLLLAKLKELRNKDMPGAMSYAELVEKVSYLQQKNELLQDAESRYMDRIVELEEAQQRLQQAECLTHSGATSEPRLGLRSDSILLFMQNDVPLESSVTPLPIKTADLKQPSEQMINLVDMPSHISQLEVQNHTLAAACEEKASQIKYLTEKLELLHDSEARLMEKLQEVEENGESSKLKASLQNGDVLEQKIEQLMEENEFLAESVENYKRLYKEEKEKTNDLNDRVLEEALLRQELHDARTELESVQQTVKEYEEQLSEKEEQVAQLSSLLLESQQRETSLQEQLQAMKQSQEELYNRLDALSRKEENPQALLNLLQEEKTGALQAQELQLRSQFDQHKQQLQAQIDSLQKERSHLKEEEHILSRDIEEFEEQKIELEQELDCHKQKVCELQKEAIKMRQKEHDLLEQIRALEKQLQEMKLKMEDTTDGREEEESAHSDSGLSVDDQRNRYDTSEKERHHKAAAPEWPVEKCFSSTVTLTLAQPSSSATQKLPSLQSLHPSPVAPPRRSKARNPSIDSISQEELAFLVEELQSRELALKKRVHDLETLLDSDLSQRVEELDYMNRDLQRKLNYAESSRFPLDSEDGSSTLSFLVLSGDTNNNNTGVDRDNLPEDSQKLDRNLSSALSSSSRIMLDRPEDILHQRIKELENLEKHHQNQLSELERDREVLHEITRKDKATIHDLSVKIRELQLSERSLKEQVNSLGVSENALYSKCEDLDILRAKLEDRVHELEIHERRLRELVRKLKLDEEHWLSKSAGMETAVAELSANEKQLKRLLQDVDMEKGGLSERAEYLEARIRELESVESTLLHRLKCYENVEVSLQNQLVQLENSEAAAHSKASELDVMNMDLSQRFQKAVEENALLNQLIAQLQGQVNELDRRLMSLRDSELAYKQHVESVQKNEGSLQKKVREFELREIDIQAQVRELEQTNAILNDKLATLQRSENKMKFRVQELEGLGDQIPGELTLAQRQMVPQKLEDCQKRVVVLQNQIENLQLQLRNTLKTTQIKLASQMGEDRNLSISVDEYSQLQTKCALLEETMYQMEEVERANEELNETILQLRQGKGASGHEVEIEVLKRRLNSYKTFINKLKSSLSMGQATSLWDPDIASGPQGDTLPARHIHGLESERVLQSVRGLQDGKADTFKERGAQQYGLTIEEDSTVQSKATSSVSSKPPSVDFDDESGSCKSEQASSREESHWRAIEARKPILVASSRGGAKVTMGAGAKHALPTHNIGSKKGSTQEVEEVTVGLHLPSESELSSHYRTIQNDTDSSNSPVPPPRRGRVNRVSKSSENLYNSGNDSSDGLSTDNDTPAQTAVATNNKHYFGNDKSLPSPAYKDTSQKQINKPAPLTSFGEDSFYLPSSTQEGVDSLGDDEAPPLPSSGPPGTERLRSPSQSTDRSVKQRQQDRKDSLENSTSGMRIRERIAMIERQLQSDQLSSKANDDQVFYWKKKATESVKQVEVLEKDNKQLKEDINRLEKELEEKRRYIYLFELWLSDLDDLLKNKNKQTDRAMVEQLQLQLTKLRNDLKKAGHRQEDAFLDPAALKTELEHRDKEIVSKRREIAILSHELKRCQEECRSIEGMRRTALDSLRALEHEIVELQDKGEQLQEAQAELKALKLKYEHKCQDLNDVMSEHNELELTLKKIIKERDYAKCDLKEAEDKLEGLKPKVKDLKEKLEDLSHVEAKNCSLDEQLKNLNTLLTMRTEKTQEVYEENLKLRDNIHQNQVELARLRTMVDDYNNLSARYDELNNYKNQAINIMQPLQAKLERLARKCQEKDALLRRLGAELRQNIYRPCSALDDLTSAEQVMSLEEYNTDFPPLPAGTASQRLEKNRDHSHSSSMEELELSYAYSDNDSSTMVSASKKKRPTHYVSNRPRSAETLGSRPSVQHGSHAHPRSVPGLRRSGVNPQIIDSGVSRGQFVAIADYNPALFSQSGRPRLELILKDGDHVLVTSPMDRTGYYEAEVNGRAGLVPANYLQPLHGSSHMTGYESDPWSVSHLIDHGPSQLVDRFRHIPGAFSRPKNTNSLQRSERHSQLQDYRRHSESQVLVPDPPHHLHVKCIVTERSVLLSWLPPKLDNKGNSNGKKVLGYIVYLNNQEYLQIPSPRVCEVVVEDLNPEHSHHLAVQCFCTGGYTSARAELIFEGVVHMSKGHGHDGVQSHEDLDTDLSSVLNSVQYKRGVRKTVIALYDYNPEKHSPHDYTTLELPFQEGTVIQVYGEPRPDGFYHGEIEGRRGLVPAYFVEDISKMATSTICSRH